MQEMIHHLPITLIRKAKYHNWTNMAVGGALSLFLDESQADLLKAMLSVVMPVLVIHAKAEVSKLNSFLLATGSMLCSIRAFQESCCS